MPPAKNISFEELSQYFHLPINQVAKELGVCATILKKTCRKNGIPRWPHRKIKSLDNRIANLKVNLEKNPQDKEEIVQEIEMLKAKRQEIMRHPDVLVRTAQRHDQSPPSVRSITATTIQTETPPPLPLPNSDDIPKFPSREALLQQGPEHDYQPPVLHHPFYQYPYMNGPVGMNSPSYPLSGLQSERSSHLPPNLPHLGSYQSKPNLPPHGSSQGPYIASPSSLFNEGPVSYIQRPSSLFPYHPPPLPSGPQASHLGGNWPGNSQDKYYMPPMPNMYSSNPYERSLPYSDYLNHPSEGNGTNMPNLPSKPVKSEHQLSYPYNS